MTTAALADQISTLVGLIPSISNQLEALRTNQERLKDMLSETATQQRVPAFRQPFSSSMPAMPAVPQSQFLSAVGPPPFRSRASALRKTPTQSPVPQGLETKPSSFHQRKGSWSKWPVNRFSNGIVLKLRGHNGLVLLRPEIQPMEIDRIEGKGRGRGSKGKGKSDKGQSKGKQKGKGKDKGKNPGRTRATTTTMMMEGGLERVKRCKTRAKAKVENLRRCARFAKDCWQNVRQVQTPATGSSSQVSDWTHLTSVSSSSLSLGSLRICNSLNSCHLSNPRNFEFHVSQK